LPDVDELGAWEAALRAFAGIQVTCAAHTEELLAAGYTELPVETLAVQFVALLSDAQALLAGQPGGLSTADVEALHARAPTIRRACARLASHALPPSLVHGDFLPANMVVGTDGTPVFFDWGEATVTHPFCSPVRFLASATWHGTPVRSIPDLYARLRDAYPPQWTAFQLAEALLDAFELARALQPVHHALTYWHLYRLLAAEGDAHRVWERRGVAAASLQRLLDQRQSLQRA
jgi:aminoglycoside phosphotransferase (APT) family kinase protein